MDETTTGDSIPVLQVKPLRLREFWRETIRELDSLADRIAHGRTDWWSRLMAFTNLGLAIIFLAILGMLALSPIVAVIVWFVRQIVI
jgi:hypothetical protein